MARRRGGIGRRLLALRRAIFAPPGNAVGRLAWRCRRAGVSGPRLDVLGDAILARLQAGIVRVGHEARAMEPASAPAPMAAAVEVPAAEAAAVEVPAMAAQAAAAAADPGAVIYTWPAGAETTDGRLLSLRAWLDYMRERGRLSPHEWTRLYELGRAPEGIQYLIRLRDYYDGSGPYPGDALSQPALRTGTAA